jgi:hypothetical protein
VENALGKLAQKRLDIQAIIYVVWRDTLVLKNVKLMLDAKDLANKCLVMMIRLSIPVKPIIIVKQSAAIAI